MQTVELDQVLKRAIRHHRAGEWDKATAVYRDILGAIPDQPNALHLSGLLAYQKGETECAVELLARAVVVAPDNAEAHFHLGVVWQALERPGEAADAYRRAIEADPGNAEAFNNLGAVCEDLDRIEEAIESYLAALAVMPEYTGARLNLGALYRKHGRPDEAVNCYRAAIERVPEDPRLHFNLGLAYKDLALLEVAEASLRRAVDIRPDYAVAHDNLGNVLRESGRFADAVECYRAALASDPGSVDALNHMGVALRELGRHDEAIASFEAALDIDPTERSVRHSLANTLWTLARYDEALALFDALETPTAAARAMECLFALGRYDEFYARQAERADEIRSNLRIAAISAFVSDQLKRDDPHPYCKHPLDFIRVYDGLAEVGDSERFRLELIDALEKQTAVWEPFGKSTVSGFQTPAVLFDRPSGSIAELKRVVEHSIRRYRADAFAESCDLLTEFPEDYSVNAWYGKLVKGGHRLAHIHPSGWISGVFYLQCPEQISHEEEGAIEFSLWGYGYPVLDENYPRKLHCPKNGDLVLFPSSLFHRTIPHQTDEDRLIVAFDLVPNR